MTTNPTALPVARLRALGCKVGTTILHNPRGARPSWQYAVTPTGPSADDVRETLTDAGSPPYRISLSGDIIVSGVTAAATAGKLATLADIVAREQDVTTPTGSDADPLPLACMNGVCGCPTAPDGEAQHGDIMAPADVAPGLTLSVYRSSMDGALVVQIDTGSVGTESIRVNVNDAEGLTIHDGGERISLPDHWREYDRA